MSSESVPLYLRKRLRLGEPCPAGVCEIAWEKRQRRAYIQYQLEYWAGCVGVSNPLADDPFAGMLCCVLSENSGGDRKK